MKMFISDLDGTLLTAKEDKISARLMEAILSARAKDIRFAVASGRAVSELWRIFEACKEQLVFVACDGALIYEGEKLIYEAPIQNLKQFNKEENLLLQGKRITYVKGQSAFVRSMKLHYGGHAVEFEDVEEIDESIYKAVVFGQQFQTEGVNVVYSDMQITEYTAEGIDKGSATRFLIERYGISPSEVAAFGDNTNDIPMLREVEHSIAVHNAKHAVLNVCKYITDDIAKKIKEYTE